MLSLIAGVKQHRWEKYCLSAQFFSLHICLEKLFIDVVLSLKVLSDVVQNICGGYNLHLLLQKKKRVEFFRYFLFSLETNATILKLIYSLFIPENQAMHSGIEISTEFFSREARKSMFRAALDSCNLRFNGNHFLIQPVILLTPILSKVCTQNNFFDPSNLLSIELSIRYSF